MRCGWSAGPGLLRSCSAYGAYLRVERDRVEPVGVIRFLVLNHDFPRAIRFCVARCRESLQEIAGADDDEYRSEAARLLGRLDSELRYIDVAEIFERGLLPFLEGIQTTCQQSRPRDPAAHFFDLIGLINSDEFGTTMLLHIQHETKLSYSEPVSETVFEVRMAPPSDEDQTNLGYRLRISPSAPVTIYRDGFGNRIELFNILTSYRELIINGHVDRAGASSAGPSRGWRKPGRARIRRQAIPRRSRPLEYLQPSPLVKPCRGAGRFRARASRGRAARCSTRSRQLAEAVRSRLTYEKKVTTARTPVGEALRLGRGVCQDFAHLFLGGCRGIGLPARYVSGYVHQPGEVATHAWCQVWVGNAGWIDVDPTRGNFPDNDYVTIAIGRDYSDVPPNRGVWKGQADETIGVTRQGRADRARARWIGATGRTPRPHGRWLRGCNPVPGCPASS